LLAFNANVNANKKTHEIWAKNDVGGIFGRFVKIAPNVVMTSKFTKKKFKTWAPFIHFGQIFLSKTINPALSFFIFLTFFVPGKKWLLYFNFVVIHSLHQNTN